MNPDIAQLALSPRGRKTLAFLLRFMPQTGIGLDSPNRAALLSLVQTWWEQPATIRGLVEDVLDASDSERPTIYVSENVTDDHVDVHVPKELGDIEVVLLQVDDPDSGSYDARGIPHPASEHDELKHNPLYNTHSLK